MGINLQIRDLIFSATGTNMKFAFYLTILALVLPGCSKTPPLSPTPALSDAELLQCYKDTDCKGSRICDAGKCAAPPNPVVLAQPIGSNPPNARIEQPPPAASPEQTAQELDCEDMQAQWQDADRRKQGPGLSAVGAAQQQIGIELRMQSMGCSTNSTELIVKDGPSVPTTPTGDFAVSAGSYATAEDADRVLANLQNFEFSGYREPVNLNGRDAYRVRLGPFADRDGAESVRRRVNPNLKPKVIEGIQDHPVSTAEVEQK